MEDDKMKAALKTLEGDFELSQVKTPEIKHPDWVLAWVKVAGICSTGLHPWKMKGPELIRYALDA